MSQLEIENIHTVTNPMCPDRPPSTLGDTKNYFWRTKINSPETIYCLRRPHPVSGEVSGDTILNFFQPWLAGNLAIWAPCNKNSIKEVISLQHLFQEKI